MRRLRSTQAGVTLIELMISLVVVGIAVGFIFRIYATSAVAYRSQRQIAELQQTLRAAKEQVARDVRMAGFLSADLKTAVDPTVDGWDGGGGVATGGFRLNPIAVKNSATGPDELRVVYADMGCSSEVVSGTFGVESSAVVDDSCFSAGDLIAIVRPVNQNENELPGKGCLVQLSGVTANVLSYGAGPSWNVAGNPQCADLAGVTRLMATKMVVRAYRVDTGDVRGFLQMSESGGILANDWETLALGFVDLQVAIKHWEPLDTALDDDNDGDPKRDWLSGDNMAADLFVGTPPDRASVMQVRISMAARTIEQIDGVATANTPAFLNGNMPVTNNDKGDKPAQTATQGNYVYRAATEMIDMRNLSIGL